MNIKSSLLNRLPTKQAFHIWADYIELMCLVNADNFVTKADVLDRLQDSEDLLELIEDKDDWNSIIEDDEDKAVSKKRDEEERKIADWFSHLTYRQAGFGEFYPFSVSNKGDMLTLAKEITLKHKFYVFLLLASNLRYFQKYTSKLTSTFEVISSITLREMLPESAEVHLFRPSKSVENRHYEGNLKNRISILAKDLRETVRLKDGDISEHDSGDGGLDIVGWVPAGDETTSGLLSVFGQCACTEEWVTKQHSSSLDTWRAIINFTSPPTNMVFIPFCFRKANGEWWLPKDIHQTVVIDRGRFVYFLNKHYEILTESPAYAIVNEFLAIRESLV